ncbi:MAG: hypothetical protein RLN60_00375 [Phycisphaerales bacterium]
MSSELHERLNLMTGDDSFRIIGEKTQHNSETARRYMKGQSPSVDFIAAFCLAYDVNESWLLTGRGPTRASDVRRHQLSQANPSELLSALAEALVRLTERVDRIESFIQTMETRLRVRGVITYEQDDGIPLDPKGTDDKAGQDNPTARITSRAERVADGLAERSSQDVD